MLRSSRWLEWIYICDSYPVWTKYLSRTLVSLWIWAAVIKLPRLISPTFFWTLQFIIKQHFSRFGGPRFYAFKPKNQKHFNVCFNRLSEWGSEPSFAFAFNFNKNILTQSMVRLIRVDYIDCNLELRSSNKFDLESYELRLSPLWAESKLKRFFNFNIIGQMLIQKCGLNLVEIKLS